MAELENKVAENDVEFEEENSAERDEEDEEKNEERDEDMDDPAMYGRYSTIQMDYRYTMYFHFISEHTAVSILLYFYSIMWIRDKVIKFLGLSGYELLFYKLLNVKSVTETAKLHRK